MKAWFILLLTGLVTLGSCTIEKRLYNKGWHVEFHRKNSSDKARLGAKNSAIPDSVSEVTFLTEISAQVFEGEDERAVKAIHPKDSVHYLQVLNQEREVVKRSFVRKNTVLSVQAEKHPVVYKKANPSSWSKSGKRTSVVVVAILLILALILLFSLLFIIKGSGDIAALFALGFFAVIIGLLALILLFLLLTMLLVKSQERINEEATEKENERQALENLPPEEKEKYLKEQKTNNREGKIAAGFVVIVLLLILGAAVL